MNDDNLEHWVDKAQMLEALPKSVPGVRVIKNNTPPQSRGATIMEVFESILPVMQKIFLGRRDNQGMLLQPAHIRGIAFNYAENLMKIKEADDRAA